MPSKTPLRPKHVPQRTCVGCGTTAAKRTLIRIVRSGEGQVEADPTGKRAARGAYLCSNPECWDVAIRKGRLERSLKTTLSPAATEALRAFAQGLGITAGGAP